ncbi:putative adhesin [Lachnotalea glycerini]|uniref:Putative adhesin n=1 Tax=Lachnotalea glycerini TaxID=1763509 RepID=A0A255IHU2_9FIRM|nr:DUF4097 family beta strand repeat-containing protein [Lachnotalea glycerini]PXV91564.1 putative adhesin [Lachnotalea glycerini]RDY27814.1 hypothetical protein CG710_020235 [Lachnotalea glycerini]
MEIKLRKIIILIMIGVLIIMGIIGFGASRMLKEINKEENVSIENINKIQVDMNSSFAHFSPPVHFIETKDDSDVKMILHGTVMADINIITEIKDNMLIIKLQRTSKIPLYEDFVLDIYIPKDYENNLSLDISSSSGSITVDSMEVANLTFNTSSGIVKAETLIADKISINTSSGNVDINKIDTNELEIKGKSSSINVYDCNAKQSDIETLSGSVTINSNSGSLTAKTGSGKVFVTYEEFEDQEVNIESSSGSVTLELPSTAEFSMKANTSSGKIQSDFQISENESTDKKKLSEQVGTKNNNIILQTASGSIKILKK